MTLYRVIRERGRDQGGYDEVYGTEVLYCGYDYREYRRVFHASAPLDVSRGPGNNFTRTRGQKKVIEEKEAV